MPVNTDYIDLLIQYALLAAGQEDDHFDRRLGPIHLIKYVYLADLFYAKKNKGQTYTGVDWQFYKFGPWAQSVNTRIDPALNAIHANKYTFESEYEGKDEWFRWDLSNDQLYDDKESKIPSCITLHLKGIIHKYNRDTYTLLDFVYKTKPMLAAAPSEILDLSKVLNIEEHTEVAKKEKLSKKKQKKFAERMKGLQAKFSNRTQKKRNLVNPISNPRFDEVFEEGVAWLDDLSGTQIPEEKITVKFDDDIWKSESRNGDELP